MESPTTPFDHYATNADYPGLCASFFPRTNVENYLHTLVLERKNTRSVLCVQNIRTRVWELRRVVLGVGVGGGGGQTGGWVGGRGLIMTLRSYYHAANKSRVLGSQTSSQFHETLGLFLSRILLL